MRTPGSGAGAPGCSALGRFWESRALGQAAIHSRTWATAAKAELEFRQLCALHLQPYSRGSLVGAAHYSSPHPNPLRGVPQETQNLDTGKGRSARLGVEESKRAARPSETRTCEPALQDRCAPTRRYGSRRAPMKPGSCPPQHLLRRLRCEGTVSARRALCTSAHPP